MRRAALLLLALALAVRLAALAATPDYAPRHDDRQYDGMACAIVEDGSYPLLLPRPRTATSCGEPVGPPNPPTAFRPPAFPALLAGVYAVSSPVTDHRWAAARIAQALIGTAGAGLMGLVALQLFGPAAGVAALALGALAPTLVIVGAGLFSEPLFVVFALGAIAATLAARGSPRALRFAMLAGALVGAATLVRSNGLALALPLAFGLWRIAGWRAAAALALASALVVAPWTVRNAVQMDAFVPVASYVGSGFAGTFNEEARTRTDHPGAWRSPSIVAAFQDIHHSDLGEIERQAELRRRAFEHAAEHPGYVVTAGLRNAARILAVAGPGWWRENAEYLSQPRAAGDIAGYGFLALLVLAVAGAVTGAARSAPRWLWLIPALLLASAIWVGGEARYRAPVEPFAVLLAAPLAARLAAARRLRRA